MNLYHRKYIKYKSKYLNLLDNLKGGSLEMPSIKPPIYFVSIAWTISNGNTAEILPFSTLLYLLITKLIHKQFEHYGTIIQIYENLNINLNDIFDLVDNKLTFKNNNHEKHLKFTTEIECLQLCFEDLQINKSINEEVEMFNTFDSCQKCEDLIKRYINESDKSVMFTIHINDINNSEDYCNNICTLLIRILIVYCKVHYYNISTNISRDISEDISEDELIKAFDNSSDQKTIYDENDCAAIKWYYQYSKSKTFKLLLFYYYKLLYNNKILKISGLNKYGILEVTVPISVLKQYISHDISHDIPNIQILYSDIYYSITNNILNTICFMCKLIEYKVLKDFDFLKKKLINYILMYYLSYNKNVSDILNKEIIKEYLTYLFNKTDSLDKIQLTLSDKLIILFILLYHTHKKNISYLLYTYSERMDYAHTGYKGFNYVFEQLNKYFNNPNSPIYTPIQLLISDSTIGDQSDEFSEKQRLLEELHTLSDAQFKITCGQSFAAVAHRYTTIEGIDDVSVYTPDEYEQKTNTELDTSITITNKEHGIVFVLGGNDVYNIINNISNTLKDTLPDTLPDTGTYTETYTETDTGTDTETYTQTIDDIYSDLPIVTTSNNNFAELCNKLEEEIKKDKIYNYTWSRITDVGNNLIKQFYNVSTIL